MPEPTLVRSPCIGICRMDEATGWCDGCLRTAGEIAEWRSLSVTAQLDLWHRLPERHALAGAPVRLLPWAEASAAVHMATRLRAGGRLSCQAGPSRVTLQVEPGAAMSLGEAATLMCRTAAGAALLRFDPALRLFAIDMPGEPAAIALAMHHVRLRGLPGGGGVEFAAGRAVLPVGWIEGEAGAPMEEAAAPPPGFIELVRFQPG